MTEKEPGFELSDLEAWILETIDNIGWHAYLWFPVVQREALNFAPDEADEEVYAAFVSLVRKNALEDTKKEWEGAPEWKPAPGALRLAKDILCSKFGWP